MIMTLMNSVKGFPTKPSKGKYRDKEKEKLTRRIITLEKRKIKLMEERLMKKSQVDEDEEDYMFLVSLFQSIKINHTKFKY